MADTTVYDMTSFRIHVGCENVIVSQMNHTCEHERAVSLRPDYFFPPHYWLHVEGVEVKWQQLIKQDFNST